MNITEFAEQIVFGTTLEEKLQRPGKLTYDFDKLKAPRVDSLLAPSRPQGMQMQLGSAAAIAPPSDGLLENEYARGQLLHFLANHELLATELMALVLLKFPEAPRAFRQGILVTLQEEQEHTRMYMRRMKECGVELGSHQLSGQFWRIVEPMQSPMDFVARLSLTFEQANLDYSQHFAGVFRKIGDDDTAAVLQQIYEDEIGHVQHGLQWFRQWKDPTKSDWDAYKDSLEFPMSPQRGKGPSVAFNREGRQRAGLSDEFIDAIEVFRQSRGRASTLRWFDPAAESELAGEADSQTSLMQQLGRDLELVMIATSKPDDILLVRDLPSQSFCKRLIDAGFELPEFARFEEVAKLRARKLHDLLPWAWTPRNHEQVAAVIPDTRHRPQPWKASDTDLYRKSWCVQRLGGWLSGPLKDANSSSFDWLPEPSTTGICLNSIEEIESAKSTIAANGYKHALFKQDLATSGRGQRRFATNETLTLEDLAWLRHRETGLASQDSSLGVIEPELKRLVDLSYLWHMPPATEETIFLGWTRPMVTSGRRYAGTHLRNAFHACNSDLKRFLLSDRCLRLKQVAIWLESTLLTALRNQGYVGYIGVDAFVYEDDKQAFKIKPLVELNPRMTMGHQALGLEKRLAPGAEGEFRILTRPQWQAERESLMSRTIELTPSGHLKSGFLALGDFQDATKLFPVLIVGK